MNHYKVVREITKTIEIDASDETEAVDSADDAKLDQWVSVTRSERVILVHPVIPQPLHKRLQDTLDNHQHRMTSGEEHALTEAIAFMELLERIKEGR